MNQRDRDETATDLSLLKRRDSICERFEHDLKSGRSPRLETFLAEVSPAVRRGLLMDLLTIEVEHRSRAGERPSPNEYYHRFPEYPSVIASAIQHMMSVGNNLDGRPLRAPPKVELKSGEQIENFEIIRVLGRGQFAIVYLAQQLTVNREVALKVSQLRSADHHEHHNLAKVDGHPNIVRMYDHRSCEERGLQLVYMEVVRGGTLREEIERTSNTSPLPGDVRARCERVWAIGPPLADALEYAHRNGVFHRDIKPANILLDEQGNPKLADFNVAQRTNLGEIGIGGTLAYMSPEQLDACCEPDQKEQDRKVKQLDGRSDIYSIGLVLWELVTLKRPFEVSHESDGLPPDVPEGLKQVLRRCLAPDPADRYPSAGELARDLRMSGRGDVQALIYPPKARWRELILRWPLAFLIFLGVLCNLGPSVLDITYNYGLLEKAGEERMLDKSYYTRWVLLVNSFAYGSAILISAALGRPMIRALHALSAHAPVARLPEAIARGHLLGHYVAMVNFAVGAVASLAWAAVIGGQLWENKDWSQWKTVHFAGSVFLSVLIAAPAAFFTITFTCSRVFLPRLARETRTWPTIDLEPRIRFHLGLLLFGPSVTITLFWWVRGADSATPLLIWFCLLSFGAIQLGFTCASVIRSDLKTLAHFRDGS